MSHASPSPQELALAQLLTERLEKLRPDSLWARRASGIRGALLRALTLPPENIGRAYLLQLTRLGFAMLARAASESGSTIAFPEKNNLPGSAIK